MCSMAWTETTASNSRSIEGEVFGHHVHHPVGARHLRSVWVGIDADHVDPTLGEAGGQMTLSATHLQHPLPGTKRQQPVDATEVGGIPSIDQRIAT